MPSSDLVLATGSVALIYQLVQTFCEPGDEVVYAWRSFEAYPIAATVAAATSVRVPVTADGRHDLDAMLAAITDRTRVVLVCTPNNPTGPGRDAGGARRVHRRGPAARAGRRRRGLRRVRADGRPGRRRGDVPPPRERRAHPHLLQGLRARRAPRRVRRRAGARSPPRCARCRCPSASPRSPRPRPWPRWPPRPRCSSGSTRWSPSARGCSTVCARPVSTCPTPRATSCGSASATGPLELAAACDAAGVVVRPFAGDGVRASIGEPEANDRLLEVARAFRVS